MPVVEDKVIVSNSVKAMEAALPLVIAPPAVVIETVFFLVAVERLALPSIAPLSRTSPVASTTSFEKVAPPAWLGSPSPLASISRFTNSTAAAYKSMLPSVVSEEVVPFMVKLPMRAPIEPMVRSPSAPVPDFTTILPPSAIVMFFPVPGLKVRAPAFAWEVPPMVMSAALPVSAPMRVCSTLTTPSRATEPVKVRDPVFTPELPKEPVMDASDLTAIVPGLELEPSPSFVIVKPPSARMVTESEVSASPKVMDRSAVGVVTSMETLPPVVAKSTERPSAVPTATSPSVTFKVTPVAALE